MESISKPRAKEFFKTGEDFYIRDTRIEPFSVVHDAADPVGFAMYAGGLKLVICTDLGRVTTLVREHLKDANAVVLESNHDLEMLQSCDYTWELKQRIASTHGHLSNESAGELIEEIMHPELFHIVLGHLSENSNTPTLALDTAKRFISQCQDRACGLQTLLCGNIYSTLPCLELDVSSAPRVLMSA
jgi:phosphoribosyl 1,2-cyclic phosphodiesterase